MVVYLNIISNDVHHEISRKTNICQAHKLAQSDVIFIDISGNKLLTIYHKLIYSQVGSGFQPSNYYQNYLADVCVYTTLPYISEIMAVGVK